MIYHSQKGRKGQTLSSSQNTTMIAEKLRDANIGDLIFDGNRTGVPLQDNYWFRLDKE